MLTEDFMRSVFEIAFGSDAADREFTREDVLQRLREFSDSALKCFEWTPYDVQEHQPDWGIVECQAWLESNEEKLRERTSELGSEAMADMLMNTEPAKSYDNCTVSIWEVTYFLKDEEGEDVLNEDGSVKLFRDTNGAVDHSTWCEFVEADDLEEINE